MRVSVKTEEALKSYMGGGGGGGDDDNLLKTMLSKPTASSSDPLKDGSKQSQVKSATDDTWLSMNQAVKSIVPPIVSELNEKEKAEKLETKRQKATEKKSKRSATNVSSDPATIRPTIASPVKQNIKLVRTKTEITECPIETLEQHAVREDRIKRFALNLEQSSRTVEDVVIATPSFSEIDVLAYCSQHKDEMPWFVSMEKYVAGSVYEFPDVPVLSRKKIVDFLREPNPLDRKERYCFNLDRAPLPHEGKTQCVAHRLSEERLGPGKGFRLRELVIIMDGSIPEYCYLCHLWLTLCRAIDQRDRTEERMRANMVTPATRGDDKIMIMNRFMVVVDQPGEYDRTKMLVSDKINTGIWGPFPLFNENNYVLDCRKGSLRSFVETDNLLFRLTRVSQPTQSTLTEGRLQGTGILRP